MAQISKFNIVARMQRWLDSVQGQTFLNYAYSWGAAVVILGTLFKLTHLPGANLMLFLGMGTEVVVFFISAFDRPFDKNETELATELTSLDSEEATVAQAQGGVVLVGGIAATSNVATADGISATNELATDGTAVVSGVVGGVVGGTMSTAEATEAVSEMEEATTTYVEELKKLTEMLAKVSEQSQRLTRDSEEMENLNRTLTGICKVYEMQLKGASQQIGTIDQINDQSRKMAQQIEQLNAIYARMIEAMTVNMPGAANPTNA